MSLKEIGSHKNESFVKNAYEKSLNLESEEISQDDAASQTAEEKLPLPSNKDTTSTKTDVKRPTKGNREKMRTSLQRQKTFTTSGYRYRKSISQIDMKLARRNGLLHFSPLHKQQQQSMNGGEEKLPTGQNTGNGSYFSVEPCNEEDSRMAAGMRVYITFMLNAWRKRRDEVKTLTNLVEELKKINVKAKNQLHVFNALFHVEKKSNEELSQQLKSAIEQIRQLQDAEKHLKTTLAQSERKRNTTEQQLMVKMQDHHALNVFFKQTKTELFGVMSELQETRTKLDAEQIKIKELEEDRIKMIQSVELLCEHTKTEKENFQQALQSKDSELLRLQGQIKTLEKDLINSKDCLGTQVYNLNANEVKLKSELDAAQSELRILRRCLAATMGQRIQNCWKNSILVQRASLHMFHCFASSLLPAVPAPKVGYPLPFNFSLEKAMSIIKR